MEYIVIIIIIILATIFFIMTLMRLTNILKSTGERVSRNTVSDYLGYMNEAFMTFRLTNFTDNFSERVTNCKYYFCATACRTTT